ncbi:hypothetical protein ES703_60030 [subsurface metagenome]
MSGKKWTKEEIEFMIKHRLDYSLAEMAARVGHPKSSVLDKIHDLGYTWRRKKQEHRKSWTPGEDQFLKDNYGPILTKEIAKKLNRTLCSIRNRIQKLNLWLRTKEEISKAPEFHLTDTEAAYIAGIIDGEGSFSVHLTFRIYHPNVGLSLSITNTSLDLIEWFRAKLKANQKYLYRNRCVGSKTTYVIAISQRAHLQKIIPRIFQFLIVKKRLATLFLKILELKKRGALDPELLQAILEFKELQDVRNSRIKKSTEKLREFIRGLQRGI